MRNGIDTSSEYYWGSVDARLVGGCHRTIGHTRYLDTGLAGMESGEKPTTHIVEFLDS